MMQPKSSLAITGDHLRAKSVAMLDRERSQMIFTNKDLFGQTQSSLKG
jgi:hypothetical protein